MDCINHRLKHALISFMFILVAGCSSGGGSAGGDSDGDGGGAGGGGSIASIQITPETMMIALNMEHPLVATAYNAAGGVVNTTFEWDIADTRVAITDVSGTNLTGTGIGETTITARAGGRSASAAVKVVEAVEPKIAISQQYSCGLTVVGEAWCWGANSHSSSGEVYGVLGNESAGEWSAVPVRVQGGLLFRDITAGNRHACGVTTEGQAYCWGKNDYGQLGTDEVAGNTAAPVPVKVEASFISISSTNMQTCALTEQGEAWCWPFGTTEWWNPPDLTIPESNLPFRLEGAPPLAQIAMGGTAACGLTAEGEAWCWGNTSNGRLGTNSTDGESSDPVKVAGNRVFTSISTAGGTTCALDDGTPWCWGYGVLPNFRPAYEPTKIGTGNFDFVSVNVANGVRAFFLDAQGDLYWWGVRSAYCGGVAEHGCEIDPNFYEFYAWEPELLDSTHDHAALGVGASWSSMSLTTDGMTTGWGTNLYGSAGLGTGDIWYQRNPARPQEFALTVENTSILVEPGKSVRIPISVTRQGGFNIYTGAGFNETISLSALGLPEGVTANFTPQALRGSLTQAELVLTASANVTAYSGSISIRASAPGSQARTTAVNVSIPMPAGDGDLNLVCTSESTPMPSGYHCMNNGSGNFVPGKFNIPTMHGTWVDTEIGLCIRWGANGDATARFRAPQLGGGSTEVQNGIWGVISRSSGQPEGNETQWYVFTSPADAQTKLLSYNSLAGNIIGWNFVKSSSCPW